MFKYVFNMKVNLKKLYVVYSNITHVCNRYYYIHSASKSFCFQMAALLSGKTTAGVRYCKEVFCINCINLNVPFTECEGFKIGHGFINENGAVCTAEGISFTIQSRMAEECTLHLFMDGMEKMIPVPGECHTGDVFSMFVYGLNPEGILYAYSFSSHNTPIEDVFGNRKLFLDPYAKEVSGSGLADRQINKRASGKRFVYMGKIPDTRFDWGNSRQAYIQLDDMVIYEMHIKGFTKDAASGVSFPGTYAGMEEKIPYLKELGINTVELMPIFEFDEADSFREYDGKQLVNYWGYNTVSFFAPKEGFAWTDSASAELKHLIKNLKEAGISVILDVVFNHTAEGNEKGPEFSFKGIDRDGIYMMEKDGIHYKNYSGCGNTVNGNGEYMRRFILDCLRYWVREYKVDGFRFDLASILTRDADGTPLSMPPVIMDAAQDKELAEIKLIAEAWDAGGLYQVGSFPHFGRWSEWNGRYRDDLRRFLKGDAGMCYTAAQRIAGSHDIYHSNQPAAVSFITCHDGFTLYDLYAYSRKHNETNGWSNTDGDNNGNSWNCGEEGETDRQDVKDLRCRMVKNAFAALMMTRGPVMFLSGDEFCNSQGGNNNAYCQDNETGWVNWDRLEKYQEVHDFVKHMIQFRAMHPVIRKPCGQASCGFPSVSIHNGKAWDQPGSPYSLLLGILYAGKTENGEDDIVLYLMNAYWKTQKMELPALPDGMKWRADACTYIEYREDTDTGAAIGFSGGSSIYVPERTAVILTAEKET